MKTIQRFYANLANDELIIFQYQRPQAVARAYPTAEEAAAQRNYQIELIRVASDVAAAFQWLDTLNSAEVWNIENSIQGPQRVALLREVGIRNKVIARWIDRAEERAAGGMRRPRSLRRQPKPSGRLALPRVLLRLLRRLASS